MPPKRPRLVPSQTNISVQDVRDYSTPDGAAMANEEMRRLKLAIDQVKEEQAVQAAGIIAAGGGVESGGGGTGDVIIPAEVSYSFFIKAENYRAAEVKDKETVILRGVDGIRVSQVGKTITIGMPPVNWIVRGDRGVHSVKTTSVLRIVGINGVSTSVDTSIATLTIDRPLTVYQRSIAIGDAGTIGLDFFNETNYKPSDYILPVYFQVTSQGSGVRRIKGWTVSGGGSTYHWHASDGQHTHQVVSGSTVIWQGTNGVVVTLVPGQHTFTIDRPLQIQQRHTNIGGEDTTHLNFDNSTVQRPLGHNSRVWTEVVDDLNGKRSVRFYYDPAGTTTTSLQIQQRSIDIGGSDTGTLNFDNDVNVKPQNYTGRVYAQVVDDQNGKRSVRLWHTPGDLNFSKWRIAASETPDESEVLNNELVKFVGKNGILASRVGDDIHLEIDKDYWTPTPGSTSPVKKGVLIFDFTDTDYISGAKPAYRYGVRKYQDIVHNWGLGNPYNFEFQLLDINENAAGDLVYYRSGNTTMAGQIISSPDSVLNSPALGKIRFRNIPHVVGYDGDTVRVYATMSRGKPTEMRFRYFLRRL